MPHLSPDPQDADFLEAMREMGAFLDITPNDATELFQVAHRHAVKRLLRSITVESLMTRSVITLTPEQSAADAARVLAGAKISGAPVMDGDAVLGVVSVKDFLVHLGLPREAQAIGLVARLLDGHTCTLAGLRGITVAGLMTAPALTIAPEVPAAEAARIMAGSAVNRLPVTAEGHLVGILTRTDLANAFGTLLEEQP